MKRFLSIIFVAIMVVVAASGVYLYIGESARGGCSIPSGAEKEDKLNINSHKESLEKFEFQEVEEDYFDDALFIGDSRTDGLRQYGGLYNADYFCRVGLTVGRVFNVMMPSTYGSQSLLSMLKYNDYGKVYIMFGVNELTGDLAQNAAEFCQLLTTVRKHQPDALIFIEANLHVGKNRSESWELYSNQRLDEYNDMLSINADNETVFYIDINEVYDDEEGNLAAEFTADDLHLLPYCYEPWVDYLKNHAVK